MPYALTLYFVLCFLVAYYGRRTKLGFIGMLCASIFFTPMICFVILLLLSAIPPVFQVKNKLGSR